MKRRFPVDEGFQRAPGDILHRDVVRAIVRAAGVDTDDVGVPEAGGVARFPPEALDSRTILGPAGVEHLQRQLAFAPEVLCPEHVGGRTRSDTLEEAVAASTSRPDSRSTLRTAHIPSPLGADQAVAMEARRCRTNQSRA